MWRAKYFICRAEILTKSVPDVMSSHLLTLTCSLAGRSLS